MKIDAAMIVVVVAAVAGVRDGEADCRKACEAGEVRDGRGCCVAAPTVKPPKGKKPVKGSRTKRRGRGTPKGTTVAPKGTTVTPTAPVERPSPPPRSLTKRSTDELLDDCRGRDAPACGELAGRDDSAIDPGAYVDAMTIGCDLAVWAACTELGSKVEKGAGVKQDFARARGLYTKACDRRYLPGCDRLGQVYFLALGTVKDLTRARALFRKACDGGYSGGCGDLGFLEESEGNYAEAATLYIQSCDLGSSVGCSNAGILFDRVGDRDQAATYFQKACDLGRTELCVR
jgi:hypothetical protein